MYTSTTAHIMHTHKYTKQYTKQAQPKRISKYTVFSCCLHPWNPPTGLVRYSKSLHPSCFCLTRDLLGGLGLCNPLITANESFHTTHLHYVTLTSLLCHNAATCRTPTNIYPLHHALLPTLATAGNKETVSWLRCRPIFNYVHRYKNIDIKINMDPYVMLTQTIMYTYTCFFLLYYYSWFYTSTHRYYDHSVIICDPRRCAAEFFLHLKYLM